MNEKISPFVQANKAWIVRKTIAGYFRAKNMFDNMDRDAHSHSLVKYDDVKRLSEILFAIKEDLHLIFKRAVKSRKERLREKNKYAPNQDEIDLMNNVGLLYHKAMAARELVYVMEHYMIKTDEYEENREYLSTYLKKMRQLFSEGIKLLHVLLAVYIENDVILAYLVENDHYVKKSMGVGVVQLLELMIGKTRIDQAYFQVCSYCIHSGWPERAKKTLMDMLKMNPHNTEAKKMLQEI
jgi:hypothetical protein